MTRSDYSARSDASDKALAAISHLRSSQTSAQKEASSHELLDRLCWLAPDAVLEAVDAARRSAAAGRIAADTRAVRELCAEVYRPEGVAIWMSARNQSLGGRTATELIEAGETERVLEVLDQLASGAYT